MYTLGLRYNKPSNSRSNHCIWLQGYFLNQHSLSIVNCTFKSPGYTDGSHSQLNFYSKCLFVEVFIACLMLLCWLNVSLIFFSFQLSGWMRVWVCVKVHWQSFISIHSIFTFLFQAPKIVLIPKSYFWSFCLTLIDWKAMAHRLINTDTLYVLSVLQSLVTDLGIFWVQYKLISIGSTCGIMFISTKNCPLFKPKCGIHWGTYNGS